MSNAGWTEGEVKVLRQLQQQGKTATQISSALGTKSRNAVLGKMHRLKPQQKPNPRKPTGHFIFAQRNPSPQQQLNAQRAAMFTRWQQQSLAVPVTLPKLKWMAQQQPSSTNTPRA